MKPLFTKALVSGAPAPLSAHCLDSPFGRPYPWAALAAIRREVSSWLHGVPVPAHRSFQGGVQECAGQGDRLATEGLAQGRRGIGDFRGLLRELDINVPAVPGLLEPREQCAGTLEDPVVGIARREQPGQRAVVGKLTFAAHLASTGYRPSRSPRTGPAERCGTPRPTPMEKSESGTRAVSVGRSHPHSCHL
jgi:hypothetical protein